MKTFPTSEKTFLLDNIEIATNPAADENNRRNITAIICHPHPLHGGTMNNKVVTTLAKTLKDLNIRTVRFNFRGVGKSEGEFDNGIAESDDVLKIAEWVKEVCPGDDIWLAGFSFGAFVSARASTQMHTAQLISIAPQVSRFIEDQTPEITCPWVLVQGEKDDVTPAPDLYEWLKTRKNQPKLIKIPEAGHYFHGVLKVLEGQLRDVLLTY